MVKKVYELHLPYYKQGDDLADAITWIAAKRKNPDKPDTANVTGEDRKAVPADEALIDHAEMMEASAGILRRLAGVAKEHGLEIEDAGTHFIAVSVDEAIGEVLVQEDILQHGFWEDEDLEEDDEDLGDEED